MLFMCILDFQNLKLILILLVISFLSVLLDPRRVLQCEDGNIYITVLFSMFGIRKKYW